MRCDRLYGLTEFIYNLVTFQREKTATYKWEFSVISYSS